MNLSIWDWILIVISVASVIGNTAMIKDNPTLSAFNALWGLVIGYTIWA